MLQFETGTIETKKQIIQTLGSNLYLTDKVITIELANPLELIKNIAPEISRVVKRLEPISQAQKNGEKCLEYTFNEKWRGRRDSNSRPLA